MSENDLTTNKSKRALQAVADGDWAITAEKLEAIVTVAARLNDKADVNALQTMRGETIEGSRVTVRDGVAIIPIKGSIFRYSSYFSDFSGGTSVSSLVNDLTTALNSSDVKAILFDVDSPGGEVTGVNELADMIFAARPRKPMTAYVGGTCASAAYWLASQAGDIATDATGRIGSIGVMAVYSDDRKFQEMSGVQDIEFISSQSPFKNAPPYKEEGKKRIQARIDALATVFVGSVARGRDVSTETVLKDFGQGDVLVGEDAIKAGLVDRLSSFEETLAELVSAHSTTTIRNKPSAKAVVKDKGQFMKTTIQTTDEAAETEIVNAVDKETYNAMQRRVEAAEAAEASAKKAREEQSAQLEKLSAQVSEMQSAALRKTLEEKAANFTGETAKHVEFMTSIAEKFGADSKELDFYVTQQNAVTAQVKAGKLFAESGTNDPINADSSAYAQLEAKAKTRATEKGISKEKAFVEVANENPDLYEKYQAE